MNYMFLQYILHLGDVGWKSQLFARIGSYLVAVSLKEGRIIYRYFECDDHRELRKIESLIGDRQQSVLLLELSEHESDPTTAFCPTISTGSCREAEDLFKSMNKTGMLRFLLSEPHTAEEAVCEVLLANAASDSNQTKYDLETVLRVHRQDPRPRSYLGNSVPKELCEIDLKNIIDESRFFTVFNIPKSATYFMAPYVASGVSIPYACNHTVPNSMRIKIPKDFKVFHEYKFYSMEVAARVANYVKTADQLSAIKLIGTLWQLQESIVLYGGLLNSEPAQIDDKYSSRHWKWYKDCGPEKVIEDDAINSNEAILSIKHCTGTIQNRSSFLTQNAWNLSRNLAYYSKLHTQWLYDFMFISDSGLELESPIELSAEEAASSIASKPARKQVDKPIVYMIQVTDNSLQRHKINLSTIKKVFKNLGLLSAEARTRIKKIVFICIVPDLISTKGITVCTGAAKSQIISWEAAMLELKVAVPCEAFVVKANIRPGEVKTVT